MLLLHSQKDMKAEYSICIYMYMPLAYKLAIQQNMVTNVKHKLEKLT